MLCVKAKYLNLSNMIDVLTSILPIIPLYGSENVTFRARPAADITQHAADILTKILIKYMPFCIVSNFGKKVHSFSLSVFTGYPFALVYRRFLFHQSPSVIHLFHAVSGLSLAMFNFGETEGKK